MRWRDRPWLMPALGALSLVAYAYFESLLEMVVFGLPLFCVVAGTSWLARQGTGRAAPPLLGPRSRSSWPALVMMGPIALAFAYIVHGRFTDSGLVEWLDRVQASRSGRYSERLSFLTAVMYLLILLGLEVAVAMGLRRLRRGPTAPDDLAPPSPPATGGHVRVSDPAAALRAQRRLTFAVFAGFFAAIWTIGFAAYLWTSTRHREDLSAQYEPIHLTPGGPAPAPPPGSHIALFGAPMLERALSLRQGRSDRRRFFVPIVGAGDGAASRANYVLQFEARQPPRLETPILARVGRDALPAALFDAFESSGVRIERPYFLVSLVPSRGGTIEDRSRADLELFLGVAGLSSGILLLLALGIWLVLGRKLSRLESGTARSE
jgi:hypothetical protein